MRPIPHNILTPFIARWEGLKLTPYKDGGGVWTVGYGHTGPDVVPGVAWTQEQAERALVKDLEEARQVVYAGVRPEVVNLLSDHQYAALLSFAYNTGARRGSTIWKLLNAGALDGVPRQLMRWVYDNGVIVAGLANRRRAEVQLWNTKAVVA
jgi:lysozyme